MSYSTQQRHVNEVKTDLFTKRIYLPNESIYQLRMIIKINLPNGSIYQISIITEIDFYFLPNGSIYQT